MVGLASSPFTFSLTTITFSGCDVGTVKVVNGSGVVNGVWMRAFKERDSDISVVSTSEEDVASRSSASFNLEKVGPTLSSKSSPSFLLRTNVCVVLPLYLLRETSTELEMSLK